MKISILSFFALFFVLNFASASVDSCVNRSLIIELEKSEISNLKFFFGAQSDLPYTFKEKTGTQGIGILEISYRRKKGKNDFSEPLSPDLLKNAVERLSTQFEVFKIKKLSAEFVPFQCP